MASPSWAPTAWTRTVSTSMVRSCLFCVCVSHQVPHSPSFLPFPYPSLSSPYLSLPVQVIPTRPRPPPPAVSILSFRSLYKPVSPIPLERKRPGAHFLHSPPLLHPQPPMNRDWCPRNSRAWPLPPWYLQGDVMIPCTKLMGLFPSRVYGGHSFYSNPDFSLQSHR